MNSVYEYFIRKWLKAGVLTPEGQVEHPATGRPPLNCIFPFAANSPAKLKTQKLKESSFLFSVPREPYYLRLVL